MAVDIKNVPTGELLSDLQFCRQDRDWCEWASGVVRKYGLPGRERLFSDLGERAKGNEVVIEKIEAELKRRGQVRVDFGAGERFEK
jgi:hypothetical protein